MLARWRERDVFAESVHGLQRSLVIAVSVSVLTTVVAAVIGSGAAYLAGSIVGGAGFGAAFLGGLRTLVASIPATHRASVISWPSKVLRWRFRLPSVRSHILLRSLKESSWSAEPKRPGWPGQRGAGRQERPGRRTGA